MAAGGSGFMREVAEDFGRVGVLRVVVALALLTGGGWLMGGGSSAGGSILLGLAFVLLSAGLTRAAFDRSTERGSPYPEDADDRRPDR